MTRDQIIAWIIANDEGGVANLDGDPGGLTNKGISQQFLDAVRKENPTWPASVADLTDDQIHTLYVGYFWAPIRGDDLPPGLALLMMDTAINDGPPTAIILLQQAVGTTPDAHMGPATMSALQGMGSKVLAEFAARQGVHYAQIEETKPQFELGWMRRLIRVYTAALQGA